MSQREVFLQGEDQAEIVLVKIPTNATVADLLVAAQAQGIHVASGADGSVALLEDTEEALDLGLTLDAAGITHRGRVHVHRCRRVAVTVNYNVDQKTESFPPSATVARVKKWAVSKRGFGLADIDATEHLLQVCGSTTRPDEDAHIGTLVRVPNCALCFDLVAKQRVEG